MITFKVMNSFGHAFPKMETKEDKNFAFFGVALVLAILFLLVFILLLGVSLRDKDIATVVSGEKVCFDSECYKLSPNIDYK